MQPTEFKNWIQPLSNKLYATALRLVVNREDAKDIVQEVTMKLWEKREEVGLKENADAWAIKIVMNQSLDWLKKHKPIYMDLKDEQFKGQHFESPEQQLHFKEQLNTVHYLVQKLSPLQKTIFDMRELQGQSYQEIAEVLEVDINVVKVNLHRIRKRLKEHCESLEKYGVAKD